MAATTEPIVLIRQIQGLATLLACLPADGKAKELFTLALEADEGPWLDKVGRPDDPDSDEGMKRWFESLWAQGGLTEAEQRIVDWQNDSDNMSAAIAEFQALTAKFAPA